MEVIATVIAVIIGAIAIMALIIFVSSPLSNWRWYRRLCGGRWVYQTTNFAPGIPMADYSCWNRLDQCWSGRGCGSFSVLGEIEEFHHGRLVPQEPEEPIVIKEVHLELCPNCGKAVEKDGPASPDLKKDAYGNAYIPTSAECCDKCLNRE